MINLKSKEALTEQYNKYINRYAVLKVLIPALSAELEKWEGKTFNIKTAKALADAAKTSLPGSTTYGMKIDRWNGTTGYKVMVIPEGWSNGEAIEVDNKYDNDKTPIQAFRDNLARYHDTDEYMDKNRRLLMQLNDRYSRASELVDYLKPFEDLID